MYCYQVQQPLRLNSFIGSISLYLKIGNLQRQLNWDWNHLRDLWAGL